MRKLFLFGLVIFGLFISTSAGAFYFTSFEDETEQSGWSISHPEMSGCGFSTTTAYSGLTSLYFYDDGTGNHIVSSINFSSTTNGYVSFWLRDLDATTSETYFRSDLKDDVGFDYSSLAIIYATTSEPKTDWTFVKIEWLGEDHLYRYSINSSSSDWVSWYYSTTSYFSFFNTGGGMGEVSYYLDDFLWRETDTATSTLYEVSIEPSYPYDCTWTTIGEDASSTINFNAQGLIQIPYYSNNHYAWLYGYLVDVETGISTTTEIIDISLEAGDTYDYSIPVSVPSGTYRFSLLISGWDLDSYEPINQGYWCPYTIVSYLTPTGDIPFFPYPVDLFEEEDCSGYDLLERLVCEIRNYLGSMFIPSAELVDEWNSIPSSLDTRFPRNYVSAFKSFFLNFSENTESEVLTTTIAGQELEFLDVLQLENSEGENIFTKIRDLFSLALYVMFAVWLIKIVKDLFFD